MPAVGKVIVTQYAGERCRYYVPASHVDSFAFVTAQLLAVLRAKGHEIVEVKDDEPAE